MRWGIIGTGNIAGAFARTIAEIPDMEIGAVSSGSSDRAAGFAERFGIGDSHSPHAALFDRGDLDAVYVATTNERHLEDALACVAAGIPVLCEKPLTLDAAAGRRLTEAARAAGVFLMEAMWMRFIPSFITLGELVAAGRVGEVRAVRADFGFPADLVPGHRLLDPLLGGGSLLDIGIYPLTLVHHLLGLPDEFTATALLSDTGVDLQVEVAGRHGAAVSSAGCTVVADTSLEALVSGAEGRIRLHSPFHHSQRLSIERGGDIVEVVDVPFEGSGYRFEVEHVQHCLAEGRVESPLRPHADTLAVLGWMDEIRAQIGVSYEGVPGADVG